MLLSNILFSLYKLIFLAVFVLKNMMNVISCYCNKRLSFWIWYIFIWTSTCKSTDSFWNTDVTIWCLVFLPTLTKNRITEKLEPNKPSSRIQQRSKPLQRIFLWRKIKIFVLSLKAFFKYFCPHKSSNALTVKASE